MAGLIVTVGIASGAVAGQMEDGHAAYQVGDFATALKLLQPLANEGNADAQFTVGIIYHNGLGVPHDYGKAANWYRKAAEQGSAVAAFSLGTLFYFGFGVARDRTEAAQWYKLAAEAGEDQAQADLGVMFETGEGVPQNDTEAAKWYRKAADKGNAQAQSNLGTMLYSGQGVQRDDVEAYKWFELAASKFQSLESEARSSPVGVRDDVGDKIVKLREVAIHNRETVGTRMTPDQLAEAQRRAREWKPTTGRRTLPP